MEADELFHQASQIVATYGRSLKGALDLTRHSQADSC